MEQKTDRVEGGKKYHVHVRVETAINFLLRGTNLFEPETPGRVLRLLTEYRAARKEFITGCDNETETGKCGGHSKQPTSSQVYNGAK